MRSRRTIGLLSTRFAGDGPQHDRTYEFCVSFSRDVIARQIRRALEKFDINLSRACKYLPEGYEGSVYRCRCQLRAAVRDGRTNATLSSGNTARVSFGASGNGDYVPSLISHFRPVHALTHTPEMQPDWGGGGCENEASKTGIRLKSHA